jgi:protein TonB
MRVEPQQAAFDPRPYIPGASEMAGGVNGIPNWVSQVAPPPAAPPPTKRTEPAAAIEQPSKQIRVSAGVQAARLIHKVIPQYPALARQARVSGVVELVGIVGVDGVIRQLRVISGHPLLVQAAVEAVRQWRYQPTLLNNEPVEVVAPIQVTFTLSQ